jgi:hypothetical protein
LIDLDEKDMAIFVSSWIRTRISSLLFDRWSWTFGAGIGLALSEWPSCFCHMKASFLVSEMVEYLPWPNPDS